MAERKKIMANEAHAGSASSATSNLSMNMVRKAKRTGLMVYPWSTPKPYRFDEDAACKNDDPQLYMLVEPESPASGGRLDRELWEFNDARIKQAQDTCNFCPVFHLCYQESNALDFKHTVRAGIEPTRHSSSPYHPEIMAAKGRRGGNECPQGHENWTADKRGHRRCITCDRERTRAANEVAKAERAAAGRTKKVPGVSRGVLCKKGLHDEWRVRGTSGGGGSVCLPCKRKADADYVNKKRAGTVEE